jgi:hypothetical protein
MAVKRVISRNVATVVTLWGFWKCRSVSDGDGYTVKSTKEQTDFEQLDERYALESSFDDRGSILFA